MKNFLKLFGILKGHREYYFVLALGLILVIVVFLIGVISLQGKNSNVSTTQTTPPSSSPSISILPSPSTVAQTKPQLQNINIPAAYKLVTREEQRIPLSQSDAQAKTRILKLLPSGQNYGTVYSSDTVTIEYVQSLDLFDVSILTVDVASAKQEAENWFKQEGMSQQGICDLPVGFYLNQDVANSLKSTDFKFSPLPDGC